MQDGIRVFRLNVPFLTSSNLAECRQFFDTALPIGATCMVIDLGPLQFFDSNGFAGLVRLIARVMSSCEVRLCSSSHNVHALFQLMRGNSVLKCYWSCEEAVNADPQHLMIGVASHDLQKAAVSRPGAGLVATAGD
jgi:anti-anti-sigma regulatory factor